MRCWRMRCWDIWRCWGKNKKASGLWNSVEVIRWLDPEIGTFEMNFLISKDKKSYFSISDNEWAPLIQAHWDYVSSKWWQALLARLNEFSQSVMLFLVGVNKEWEMTTPFDWWIGTYTNESMEVFNAFYEDPNEQTLAAFNTFLEEKAQEVSWWDYSGMPLHWDNMPQLTINLTYYNEDCSGGGECVETDERYSNASTLQIKAEVWDVIKYTRTNDDCLMPGENSKEEIYIGNRKIYENEALPMTVQYIYNWYTDLEEAVYEWYLSEPEEDEDENASYYTVLKPWIAYWTIRTDRSNTNASIYACVEGNPRHGTFYYEITWEHSVTWFWRNYSRYGVASEFIWTTLSLENNILTIRYPDWDTVTLEPRPDEWYEFAWWSDFPRLITGDTPEIYCNGHIATANFQPSR